MNTTIHTINNPMFVIIILRYILIKLIYITQKMSVEVKKKGKSWRSGINFPLPLPTYNYIYLQFEFY